MSHGDAKFIGRGDLTSGGRRLARINMANDNDVNVCFFLRIIAWHDCVRWGECDCSWLVLGSGGRVYIVKIILFFMIHFHRSVTRPVWTRIMQVLSLRVFSAFGKPADRAMSSTST